MSEAIPIADDGQRQGYTRQCVRNLWGALGQSGEMSESQLNQVEEMKAIVRKDLESAADREFVHVAEGRANVVYRIVDKGAHLQAYEGALIRVPKRTPGADPHSYERLQQYREEVIEPAVGRQFVVPQLLFRIDADQARQLNEKRDPTGQDKSHIEAGFAMLIQDMTPTERDFGFEFKPKWLAQSPIAPGDAKRCRTCAREAWRNSKKSAKGQPIQAPTCPIGLVSREPSVVLNTLADFAPGLSKQSLERVRDALVRTKLMEKLRDVQVSGDPGQDMWDAPEKPAFGLSMTLRDCTCFVRLPREYNPDADLVEIKLADVDEKNFVAKKDYWLETHQTLVGEGWYHMTEQPRFETSCVWR
jgi:inositol-pentakisphosphate 2-kinase